MRHKMPLANNKQMPQSAMLVSLLPSSTAGWMAVQSVRHMQRATRRTDGRRNRQVGRMGARERRIVLERRTHGDIINITHYVQ